MKMYQKQIDQLYGKRQNIDSLVVALQGTAMDREVIQAMMMGHAATKAVISENQIDAVNDLMDDIRDQHQLMDEAAEALSNVRNINLFIFYIITEMWLICEIDRRLCWCALFT